MLRHKLWVHAHESYIKSFLIFITPYIGQSTNGEYLCNSQVKIRPAPVSLILTLKFLNFFLLSSYFTKILRKTPLALMDAASLV